MSGSFSVRTSIILEEELKYWKMQKKAISALYMFEIRVSSNLLPKSDLALLLEIFILFLDFDSTSSLKLFISGLSFFRLFVFFLLELITLLFFLKLFFFCSQFFFF